MHYRRVIRYGGTGPAYEIGKAASLEDRFENAVQSDGVCFLWHGSVSKNGYGTIGFKGRKLYAHRVAWQLAHGEYPLGRISWTCGQRLCVRADHLKQG
jgi:hypothetical protein